MVVAAGRLFGDCVRIAGFAMGGLFPSCGGNGRWDVTV